MISSSILGIIGTVIGLVRAVPQLIRLLRNRHAYGVSLDTAATSSIVSFGWATYGMLTGQLYVSLASGSTGVIFAMVTVAAIRFGHHVNELRVTPIWLAVLLLVGFITGKTGLGILLPVSVLVANIPQLWVACKGGNLSDLSLGTWLLSVAEGLCWSLYAYLRVDASIAVFGVVQFITSGLIVMVKLKHFVSEKTRRGL